MVIPGIAIKSSSHSTKGPLGCMVYAWLKKSPEKSVLSSFEVTFHSLTLKFATFSSDVAPLSLIGMKGCFPGSSVIHGKLKRWNDGTFGKHFAFKPY